MWHTYFFRLRNCLFHRNGFGDVFGTIPSSSVQFKGESTWTDRNKILFKPGKHNVCQDEGLGEILENVCKKYILAKWQFVRATGKIIDHVLFLISRHGGFLNDPSFHYRKRSFSSSHMTTDIAWWVKCFVHHISCCFGLYYSFSS